MGPARMQPMRARAVAKSDLSLELIDGNGHLVLLVLSELVMVVAGAVDVDRLAAKLCSPCWRDLQSPTTRQRATRPCPLRSSRQARLLRAIPAGWHGHDQQESVSALPGAAAGGRANEGTCFMLLARGIEQMEYLRPIPPRRRRRR